MTSGCLITRYSYSIEQKKDDGNRPRPMSRKTSVKGGEKSSLFELQRLEIGGVSFDDFSLLHASFSSETGVVLTFFAYFFASRQKE